MSREHDRWTNEVWIVWSIAEGEVWMPEAVRAEEHKAKTLARVLTANERDSGDEVRKRRVRRYVKGAR